MDAYANAFELIVATFAVVAAILFLLRRDRLMNVKDARRADLAHSPRAPHVGAKMRRRPIR